MEIAKEVLNRLVLINDKILISIVKQRINNYYSKRNTNFSNISLKKRNENVYCRES